MIKNRKKKGEFGYTVSERKKRLIITLIMFMIPLIIFFTGLYMYHTRKNILTLIAIMGCLPASKTAVDLILIFMQKPMSRELYDAFSSEIKDMTALYELTITTYEKKAQIQCILISGLNVMCFSEDPKMDTSFFETYIKKILQGNGYRSNVKIFTEKKAFLRRVCEIYPNHKTAEAEVPFKPDPDYPDVSRNDLVKAVILAISV